MRLIDADALIEQMEADAEYIEEMLFKMAAYAAINDVKRQPTIDPQKWIPCSERLPEYGQAVLVALDGGSMTDGVRSADHAGRSVWDCALDNRTWYCDENIVIAWMPLPEEPYKEKK